MNRKDWGKDIRKSADPVYYGELKRRAIHNRNNPTEAERIMWLYLNSDIFHEIKFRRQHIIGQYIVDFICLSKRLIIEIDGDYHNVPNQIIEDKIRTDYLENLGYRLIRFTNSQVFSNIDHVLRDIRINLTL